MKGGSGATLRDANRHGLFLPGVQIWALCCSCFTRDLGVIWRRRGQRRRPYSLKSPRGRILIVFPIDLPEILIKVFWKWPYAAHRAKLRSAKSHIDGVPNCATFVSKLCWGYVMLKIKDDMFWSKEKRKYLLPTVSDWAEISENIQFWKSRHLWPIEQFEAWWLHNVSWLTLQLPLYWATQKYDCEEIRPKIISIRWL